MSEQKLAEPVASSNSEGKASSQQSVKVIAVKPAADNKNDKQKTQSESTDNSKDGETEDNSEGKVESTKHESRPTKDNSQGKVLDQTKDNKDSNSKDRGVENKDEEKKDTEEKSVDEKGSSKKVGDKKDSGKKEADKKDERDKKENTRPDADQKDGDKKDGDKKDEVKKDDGKKDSVQEKKEVKIEAPPKNPLMKNPKALNIKVAGKWGAAVDKTKKTGKRRSSKVDEIDPFLAKFAMARTRRTSYQKSGADKDAAKDGEDEEDFEDEEKCCQRPACCSWAYWKDYVIDPAEPLWFYWSLIAAAAVFYNLVFVFLRAVWTEVNKDSWNIYWFVADYITDAITLLDMGVRCRLGFLEQGILVVDKKRLVQVYIKSIKFPVDIVSILPLDLFYFLTGVNTLFRLNRVLRIWRVMEFYHDSETRTTYPNLFRMIYFVINICLMIHWNACIYYSMSKALGFGSDEWTYDHSRPGFSELGMRYLFSFYWSMLTLTAIGDTNPPESIVAMLYCVIVTLCGVLIFATIFGNVGAMINQMNTSRIEFQQNVDAVKRYMDIRKVSPVLQDRVIQWFAYTWNNKQSVDDKQALTILPEKLRAEIAIQVHLETLRRVGIFKDCEPGLLQELVLKLRLQVFSPGDYICRKGDIGKEMYIIKRGKLQVVSPDGKIVFVTLQDGAVFGEVSILNIAGNKTGNRRTASVRSIGYSDLFCLSKDDLWDALKEYPEAKLMLSEIGKNILRKDNLLDEEAARRKELEEMSMDTKIDHINTTMEKIGKQVTMLADNILDLQKHLGLVRKPDEEDTTKAEVKK